jgi:septum formation inhibitor MinC
MQDRHRLCADGCVIFLGNQITADGSVLADGNWLIPRCLQGTASSARMPTCRRM